jgi:hypothetical protein
MIFYATLTVLCIVCAAAALWLFRMATNAGKSAYRGLSPAARKRGDFRYAHLNSTLAQAPSPWGWGKRRSRAAQVRSFGAGSGHHHAQPLSGLHAGEPRARQTASQSTRNVLTGYDLTKKNPVTDTSSWPYRDDAFGASGSQGGAGGPRMSTASRKGGKKPWGW